MRSRPDTVYECVLRIPPNGLEGELVVPVDSRAVILFAHGSGSSRHSPRNRLVAQRLQRHQFATLLLDLLLPAEDRAIQNRFDIALLAERLTQATAWLKTSAHTRYLPVGYFGASTGAAAALVASVSAPSIFAVVSRGGRPDLAGEFLARVTAPVLLIVGSLDLDVLELNLQAQAAMTQSAARLTVVPGATHLFEQPGTLEAAADSATQWFAEHVVETPNGRVNSPSRASAHPPWL